MGDKSLDMTITISKRFIWGGKIPPSCGRHHPWAGVLNWTERRKRALGLRGSVSICLSSCFLAVLDRPHSPDVNLNKPSFLGFFSSGILSQQPDKQHIQNQKLFFKIPVTLLTAPRHSLFTGGKFQTFRSKSFTENNTNGNRSWGVSQACWSWMLSFLSNTHINWGPVRWLSRIKFMLPDWPESNS